MTLYDTIMATVTHPDWCNGDHSDINIKTASEVFHISNSIFLDAPRSCYVGLSLNLVCDSLSDGAPGPTYISGEVEHGLLQLTSPGDVAELQEGLRAFADELEEMKAVLIARQPHECPAGEPALR
ncbi:hypothetical protein ABZ829_00610 [Streptomyces xanthochromogenes]|uniref:DUF6907 domain-containing protein n=1 Tax=Streptomyces xanthochromogenes TaxID=67384 RepID=UPI0034453338